MLFGAVALLVLLRVLFGGWTFGLSVIWWCLGVIFGFVFVFGDRIFYNLVMEPAKTLGIQMKHLLKKGKIVDSLALALEERAVDKGLIMRSVVFLLVYLVLSFWAMMTVNGAWQRGFVMGIGLHLYFDFIWDYLSKKSVSNWFWQLQIRLSKNEERIFVVVVCALGILIISRL